jgi:nucleotide-binding universal stress UspA family protein
VPTDFSYAADHSLRYALQVARRLRAGVALLHVIAPVPLPELLFTSIRTDLPQVVELSEQRLGRLARRMGLRPRHQVVRTGPPAEEILRYADEIHANLILIGSHGHNALERMLIGGTAERVVRLARCPVLVIPRPDVKAVAPGSSSRPHTR